MSQKLSYEGDGYRNFINSLKSVRTREVYARCLKIYLKYNNTEEPDKLLKKDIKLMQTNVIEYLTSASVSSLVYSTRRLYFSVIKHFYEINDIVLNWKKISRYLGENEKAIADRAYTKDEIRRMVASADLRGRVIVLVLCSTGMRIGGVVNLTLSNIRKLEDHDIYEIKVYEKSRFSYICYCTPECSAAIDTYLEYRRRCGEQFRVDTPLLRGQFDRNDVLQCLYPKPLSVHTISRLLDDLLIMCGLRVRQPVITGERNRVRKEVMLSHGFRKFANTMMVKANLNVVVKEKLIGHSAFGLENSYFRPDESLLITSYLQAVPFLTISREHELLHQNHDIQRHNVKLKKENDEIIRLKEELEPLLALKNTLIKEGIIRENQSYKLELE